jgi:uncharacterized protein YkwD
VPSLALAITMAMAMVWLASATAAGITANDALQDMRSLRSTGCDGHAGTHVPLRASSALNAAATQWSRGTQLKSAIDRSGYRENQSAALHVSGAPQALEPALSQRLCAALTDPSMIDSGIFAQGSDTWIIVAAPFAGPAPAAAGNVALEVLRLVNAARAQPQRCGSSSMPAARPLQLAPLLSDAARAHAEDMLRYDYFEHTGHDGSSPAERVAATGYHYRIVGENLASGPETPQEAVRGWIASPPHCQNLMDPRFEELGVAFAATRSGEPRIYWVQVFAAQR